jgi:hypothetical protein
MLSCLVWIQVSPNGTSERCVVCFAFDEIPPTEMLDNEFWVGEMDFVWANSDERS